MSYIGNPIVSTDFPKDTFSGNGSTTAFTMSIAPASVNAAIVVVSGITQDPSTYTISGTTLTFSAAPPTGTSNISVRHLGVAGIPNVPADASVTSAKLASGAALTNLGSAQLASANMPVGSVLQVVQSTKTDTFTTSSTSKIDITGMSVTITPKLASSKILVVATVNYGGTDYNYYCDLLRGSTVLNAPASGVNPCTVSLCGVTNTTYQILSGNISYLDSPATSSATTYKLQIACQSGGTFYLNRSARNGAADSVCSSTITVMEIAQ